MNVLWLDLFATSFDPAVASVLELAVIPVIEGVRGDLFHYEVKPVLHESDLIYGKYNLPRFVTKYNARNKADRALRILYAGEQPLFHYAISSLSYGLTPPKIRDPKSWLDKSRLSPTSVIDQLFDILNVCEGRWAVAGYNVRYDYEVLVNWVDHVCGAKRTDDLIRKIGYASMLLDTFDLVKWHSFVGRLNLVNKKLETIAQSLGIPMSEGVRSDIEAAFTVAQKLVEKING